MSHGSLLIRSPKNETHNTNIDLLLTGVEYISIPRTMKKIQISEPTIIEQLEIEKILGKKINIASIFVISSSNSKFLIVASSMRFDENELDIFESPFD